MKQLLEISVIIVHVPTMEDYMKVDKIEHIQKVRTTKEESYTVTNFIPVSPFILFKVNQVMLEYNRDSHQILFKATMTIKRI